MMPVRKSQPTTSSRLTEHEVKDDYVFAERIVLDDESFEAFSAAVTNPDEPNQALRALFKK
jgi:uncharacterized protein (DUF1778 family)